MPALPHNLHIITKLNAYGTYYGRGCIQKLEPMYCIRKLGGLGD